MHLRVLEGRRQSSTETKERGRGRGGDEVSEEGVCVPKRRRCFPPTNLLKLPLLTLKHIKLH